MNLKRVIRVLSVVRRAPIGLVILGHAVACGGNAPAANEPDPENLLADAGEGPSTAEPAGRELRDAIAAIEKEDFEHAKSLLSPVAPSSKDPQLHYYFGVAQANSGEVEAAVSSLRTALQLNPQLTEASLNLAALMLDTGRVDDALAVIEAALRHAPDEPGLLQNKALGLMLGGNPAGAATVYARVVAASPSDEELRFSYAQALADAGQKEAAKVQLKKLSGSKSVAVLNSVADTLGRLGDYAACISAMDAALVIDAKSELYVRRGVCRGSLDDSSGAQADFKKATEVDPESAAAQYYLGKSLVKTDKKAAKAALETAASLAADNPKLQAAAKRTLAEL